MRVAPISLNILIVCGAWRPDSWSTPKKKILYYVYTFITSFIVYTYTLTQILDLILCVDNLTDFAENVYMMLPLLMSSCKLLSISTNRDNINGLIEILMAPPCRPNDVGEREIWDKYEKNSQSNTKGYLYVINVSVACNLLGTFLTDINKRQLPYRSWLPFDYKSSNGLYLLAYSQQIIGGLISAFVQIATDTLICGLIMQICSQIEILEYRVEKITKGSNLSLSTCIYHHDFIYRYAEMVNHTFRVIILWQFIISTFLSCFSLYQMADEPISPYFVQLLAYMAVVLSQIFYYCYFGNKLKFKSTEIINTIFGMDWPSLDMDAKRGLMMIMRRAMTPIEFVCAYIINMDLESFVNLVKTSYSVYNLLEQTKQK